MKAKPSELAAKTKALKAIVARIQGVYDDPALMAFGPLSASIKTDCLAIAEAALGPKTCYAIRSKNFPSSFLCGDGKFIMGWCSGMGKKNTLIYKSRKCAENKIKKIQGMGELHEINSGH